jgi:hypothetical protein
VPPAAADRRAQAEQRTGLTSEEWIKAQDEAFTEVVASGRFPMLFGIAGEPDFDLDLDTVFELGLKLILDGLEARLASNR